MGFEPHLTQSIPNNLFQYLKYWFDILIIASNYPPYFCIVLFFNFNRASKHGSHNICSPGIRKIRRFLEEADKERRAADHGIPDKISEGERLFTLHHLLN